MYLITYIITNIPIDNIHKCKHNHRHTDMDIHTYIKRQNYIRRFIYTDKNSKMYL